MFFTTDYIQILLHLLVFSQEAGGVPTWTTEPSNPSLAFEGDNITLHWTYNLDTTVRTAIFTDLRGGGGGKPIADKLLNNAPEVASEYQTRFRVTSSDTEASMTILGVQRSDSGLYRYEVTDNNPDRGKITSEVTILVQYPASILHISGNQTVNDGDVVTLNCTANGGPAPNINWTKESDISSSGGNPIPNVVQTRDSDNSSASFPLTITGKQDEGNYRCTADNGVGTPASNDVFITVENFRPFKTRLNTSLQNDVVLLNETFNITCSAAQANPPAKYRFYREQELVFDDNSGDGVYTTRVSDRDPQVIYRCIPYNSFGNGSEMNIDVTVHFKPDNVSLVTNISENKVCKGDVVRFTCRAEAANPSVHSYRLYENQTEVGESSSGTWNKKLFSGGYFTYRCVAINSLPNNLVGTGESSNVTLRVNVAPSIEPVASTNVTEGDDVVLFCNASGSPEPSVIWTHVNSGRNKTAKTWNITNINRADAGKYKCEASNECEKVNRSATVTVHYPPNITKPKTGPIGLLAGSTVDIICNADGNPQPSITWINASGAVVGSGGNLSFNLANESYNGFTYICTAENGIEPNASTNITLVVGGNLTTIIIRILDDYYPEYKNVSSNESKVIIGRIQNWLRLIPEINNTAVAIIVTKLSNGSVIAEVLLKFKQIVHIASLLSAIRDAAKNGSIGDLNVDPDSIALVPEPTSTSSPSTTPTTIPAAAPKTTPKNKTSDFPWWILGVAVGGLILLAIVIAIVAWCIHKKRKCRRKDTRVHSENEAQPLEEFSNGTPNGENAENNNAQVNHGYAKSGPAPTNENNEGAAGASAVPPVTYAVVDKSKKNEKPPEYAAVDKSKKKKKKSAANEEKPPEDQYAVVNKSQKKKKPEEPEQQYAQVDRSMKKKHAKPGEVLYADLGEFHGNNSLPKVSTSPEPLPPIKKPTAYVETQYADITQFLKGDATLPSSDGTGGVTPAAQGQAPAGAQVGTGGAAATPPGEEAGVGSSHVSKL